MPHIQPFAFEELPRLPGVVARRSRELARGIAASGEYDTFTARGLGRIRIRVDHVELYPSESALASGAASDAAFGLVRADDSRGNLSFERFFALSLVRTALGAPQPPVVRPLGPAERGVMAALLASVLQSGIGAGLRVSLSVPTAPQGEFVAVVLGIRTPTLGGTARLELPLSWLPQGARTLAPEAPLWLETAATIELSRTFLPTAAWSSAQPGDAVVFEGHPALADDSPWACEVRIGKAQARAVLAPNGDLHIKEPFSLDASSPNPAMSSDDRHPGAPGSAVPPTSENSAVLAAAPVEVVAEIGRLALRGDEVMGLAPGSVLPLGERRRSLITLRVGGRAWARGELVNVDNDIGVRITELLRSR